MARTVKISIEVEVPVAVCGRCGQEAPWKPAAVQLIETEAGAVYQSTSGVPPFLPFLFGMKKSALICNACEGIVRGAVSALGIDLADV